MHIIRNKMGIGSSTCTGGVHMGNNMHKKIKILCTTCRTCPSAVHIISSAHRETGKLGTSYWIGHDKGRYWGVAG